MVCRVACWCEMLDSVIQGWNYECSFDFVNVSCVLPRPGDVLFDTLFMTTHEASRAYVPTRILNIQHGTEVLTGEGKPPPSLWCNVMAVTTT